MIGKIVILCKILRKIGKNKRIAGKKNRWEKKQNRLSPTCYNNYNYVWLDAKWPGGGYNL